MKELLELATQVATTKIENENLKSEIKILKLESTKNKKSELKDFLDKKEVEIVLKIKEVLLNAIGSGDSNNMSYDYKFKEQVSFWVEILKDLKEKGENK